MPASLASAFERTKTLLARQKTMQLRRRAKPAREHPFLWKYTKEHATHRDEVLLRFLPAAEPDGDPLVSFVRHNIRGATGGWTYRQPCPRPTGFCPVCHYRETTDGAEDFRREADRICYAANVLLVQDPVYPGCNEAVTVYEFGITVHELLCGEMENGTDVFNPFIPNTLFQLRAAWGSAPKYHRESMVLPDSPPLTISAAEIANELHDLNAYPLLHPH